MLHQENGAIVSETIESRILMIRGQKVMLDVHLAELFRVDTRILVQAVKRSRRRFPDDFMFQLTRDEFDALRSQIVISKIPLEKQRIGQWSQQQSTISGRGGRRHLPFAFTEQGVAMLSSVLRSKRAIRVNIEIMRTFVRLRRILESHEELARKLAELEERYDGQFRIVFDAIRELMRHDESEKRRIGFGTP
jgi:hypothetical protein